MAEEDKGELIQLEWAYNRVAADRVPWLRDQAANVDPFAKWKAQDWEDALEEAGCAGIALTPDRAGLSHGNNLPPDRVVSLHQNIRERNAGEMLYSIALEAARTKAGRTAAEIKRRVGVTLVTPHREAVGQLLKWRNRLWLPDSVETDENVDDPYDENFEEASDDTSEPDERVPVQLYPEREPLRWRSHLLHPKRRHYRDIFPDSDWIRTFQIERSVLKAWDIDPDNGTWWGGLVLKARTDGWKVVYDPTHLYGSGFTPDILATNGLLNGFDVSAGRTDIHGRSSDAGKESLKDLDILARGETAAFRDRMIGQLFMLAVKTFHNAPSDQSDVEDMKSRPLRVMMEFPPGEVRAIAAELGMTPRQVYVNAGQTILAAAQAA